MTNTSIKHLVWKILDLEYRACSHDCFNTCTDQYCDSNPSLEGCYCPELEVQHSNGSCIARNQCFACDDQNHFEDDVWSIDKCTKCTCKNKTVTCQKTECSAIETVCDQNSKAFIAPGSESDCCPKYICGMTWFCSITV